MLSEMMAPEDVHVEVKVEGGDKNAAIRAAAAYCTGSGVGIDALCEAFFKREAEYSTGCGDGIAIPHAKIAGEVKPKVVVVRFAEPIEWEAIDDKPVRIAFCLVMPDGDAANTHLKVVSHLARKLVVKSFVEKVLSIEDPVELYQYIIDNVEE